MAADLCIHVLKEPATLEDLIAFNSNTFGSKWFHPLTVGEKQTNQQKTAWDHIAHTPSCWIGEVSWLKAALLGDSDEFVPDPAGTISELIGEELPTLTPELRDKIIAALTLENATSYETATPDKVTEFLNDHMGFPLFTVSW